MSKHDPLCDLNALEREQSVVSSATFKKLGEIASAAIGAAEDRGLNTAPTSVHRPSRR